MKKKNLCKRVLTIALSGVLVLGSMPAAHVQAVNAEKRAEKAYAKALNTGKIKYNDVANVNTAKSWYCLCDIDFDGVKELIIEEDHHYIIWKYKKGKVSKFIDFWAEHALRYCKKTNIFWEIGDADGGWANSYKRKGNKLVQSTSYAINQVKAKGKKGYKWEATKTVNGKTSRISNKKYYSVVKSIAKNNTIKMKEARKSELIQKLQHKKIYTPKDFHLSNNLYSYRGIQIVGLTSKYIEYKKVKLQGKHETTWLPYDNNIYKMKYDGKVNIYLLREFNMPNKWVKAYSGTNYEKLNQCLEKGIKNYVLIKNKKGKVTKMLHLYVA